MKIGSREVGPGHPCCIVAELSNAANGSLDRMLRLMRAARGAGADVLKIQTFTPDELVRLRGDGAAPAPWGAQGWTMRTLYQKARTPFSWLPAIATEALRLGVPWFSSVFGAEGLRELEAVGCPAYKLAALDFGVTWLRELVYAAGKPMIRSCPLPHAPPFRNHGGAQLWCPPGYPQQHLALANIRHGYDGFSYHGQQTSIPALAVCVGAHLVEVHVQLAAEPSELEAGISFDEHGLAALVQSVRHAELLLG